MAVTTTNLGVITAYGDAVAAGYTGTKAEWQALMASYATVGQQAVDAKNAAVAAKNTAVSKATEATTAASTATTKAGEASASAQSIAQSAAQIQENTDDIDQLKSELTALESDGVVPSAEQILTDNGVTDSVPYHYRKTGGDGADRLYDQIVGGTVNWNQLVQNGNFADKSNWASASQVKSWTAENGKATIVCNSATDNTLIGQSGYEFKNGHKYFCHCDYEKSSTSSTIYGVLVSNPSGIYKIFDVSQTKGTINLVYSCDTNVTGSLRIGMRDSAPTGEWTYTISNVMFIDLTAMFGSTIADYIYSLEHTTAGAGVAFFKALFPNDYYEYNAGELVSVSGLSEHKMVGFNQFDKSTAVIGKRITQQGTEQSDTRYVHSDYIKVIGGANYYFKDIVGNAAWYSIITYDSNKNFINVLQISGSTKASGENIIPYGVSYIIVNAYAENIDTVCINLSDPAKNGQYEPYKGHSYHLDSTLTLRGLFKLDANNNLYADGDVYSADGTVTRKYGIVDLGTLTWTYSSERQWFNTVQNPFPAKFPTYNTDVANIMCSKYPTASNTYMRDTDPASIACSLNNSGFLVVRDTAYTDATAFKTAMSGVMLVYELATPTTEEAEPYQHLQQCDPDGTEEYVSTGIVPIGHNSFYPENLRAKVEQLPWNFASLIAPTESAFTATRNYTTGSLFIVSNVLYKATSNIANGGTITPNTNCTATTLAEVISALA